MNIKHKITDAQNTIESKLSREWYFIIWVKMAVPFEHLYFSKLFIKNSIRKISPYETKSN